MRELEIQNGKTQAGSIRMENSVPISFLKNEAENQLLTSSGSVTAYRHKDNHFVGNTEMFSYLSIIVRGKK